MCGIIGFLQASSSAQALSQFIKPVERGIQRLRLRGPDAQGLCQNACFVLGHARLAVIDPFGGAQPLQDEATAVALTYNGEIYNFRELRVELEAKGHRFATNCDTEVVLRAWIEWGNDAFARFNGFFAIGIIDPRERKIVLARDRLGLKPLYYAWTADGLAFASSIPAMLPLMHSQETPWQCRIDLPALSHYLTSRLTTLNGRTLVQDIHQLQPGHYLELHDAQPAEETAYWQRPIIPAEEKDSTPFEQASRHTRELMEDSVRMRLVSDVPVGAFLSGGIDSSIITHLANRLHDVPLPLYCAGSDCEELNEYGYAQLMADHLGLGLHKEQIAAAEFYSNWRFLLQQKGLPLSTPNEVSIYRLATALREQCTVTLTGEGADEIFGGYVQPQFGAYDFDRTPRSPDDVDESDTLAWSLRMRYGRAWFMNDTDHFLASDSWLSIPGKLKLLHPEVWDELEDDAELLCMYEDFFNSLEGCSAFDKRMHLHTRFNLENLLLRVDSSTMAASVEARVPFTDYRLVEQAFRLPDTYKMDWSDASARREGEKLPVAEIDKQMLITTKRLPREAFRSELPQQIVQRKKMSFPVPFTDWFTTELGETLRDLCLNATLTDELFERNEIEQMFKRSDRNLWLVVNLCGWWDELQKLDAEG